MSDYQLLNDYAVTSPKSTQYYTTTTLGQHHCDAEHGSLPRREGRDKRDINSCQSQRLRKLHTSELLCLAGTGLTLGFL